MYGVHATTHLHKSSVLAALISGIWCSHFIVPTLIWYGMSTQKGRREKVAIHDTVSSSLPAARIHCHIQYTAEYKQKCALKYSTYSVPLYVIVRPHHHSVAYICMTNRQKNRELVH